MPAVLVTGPTATQKSPFLPPLVAEPSPIFTAPTHSGIARLSGPECPVIIKNALVIEIMFENAAEPVFSVFLLF